MSSPEPALPTLDELGRDLVQTIPRRRWLTLSRPLVLVGVYALACALGHYWLTPLIVFLVFVAIVTAAHDLVHGALGMQRSATDLWLFVTGAILLASGHSYRMTHLQHHRVFPGPDDPEGEPARMSLWQSIGHGPLFLPRLWLWSYRRAAARERRFLLAEACWALLVPVLGGVLWPVTPAVALYALLVWSGSWVFPLLTVHLPHKDYGDTPLTQTRTLRGRVIPSIFLELTYHLEHHLYPQVPSHHLAELSRRLEPTLTSAGVEPWYVP